MGATANRAECVGQRSESLRKALPRSSGEHGGAPRANPRRTLGSRRTCQCECDYLASPLSAAFRGAPAPQKQKCPEAEPLFVFDERLPIPLSTRVCSRGAPAPQEQKCPEAESNRWPTP